MKKNDFLIVRHSYDDHSYIDGENDTSLTKKGIDIAKKASENILPKIDSDFVIIRHSTKRRAKETAEIIGEYFLKNNITCKLISDIGLTELFQGEFNFEGMEHIERVNFLQSCWDDFEFCRKNGDLSHNFGQNKSRKIIINPGENHAQWSIRIANGMLNIIDDLSNSYQSINITHRGAIFEIQKLVEMINGQIMFDDVEKYETKWMSYCNDYLLHIEDLNSAKTLAKKYISKRSQNENNY